MDVFSVTPGNRGCLGRDLLVEKVLSDRAALRNAPKASVRDNLFLVPRSSRSMSSTLLEDIESIISGCVVVSFLIVS